MPFTFKLTDPPCDVAFLSIVDGEALYNADNARTRDVKEATIRQIGWHRVLLPQDWFFSQRALESTTHVLEAMQCTVQYLKYRCKNEEKRNIKLSASLRHCEEERAAAFEELIELRENVALYKKKLREVSQGASTKPAAHRQAPPAPLDGLPCAFCDNVYPSRHALESHFRKRHKRPPGYAAMAAASAAVEQQQQQQAQQQEMHKEVVAPKSSSNLPFMSEGSPSQAPSSSSPSPAAAAAASLESRGNVELREELSELRLAVAKLLTQQAEFYRGMSPSCVAAVPLPSAGAATSADVSRAAPSRAPTAAATSGPLPGLSPSSTTATDANGEVLLRIPHELLHMSAELRTLQDALARERRRGATGLESAPREDPRTALRSPPPPQDLAPSAQATRPTLDPRSFLRSSASDSVLGSAPAGAGSRRRSAADSFVEVSPMSPSPTPAQHARRRDEQRDSTATRTEDKALAASSVLAQSANATVPAIKTRHHTGADATTAAGAKAAREPQLRPPKQWLSSVVSGMSLTADSPPSSFKHALTAPSDYGSLQDDLTMSGSDRPQLGATHTPPPGDYKAVRASADSGRASLGLDFDSPMVRLPSSSDALTRDSVKEKGKSPSANRYAPLPLSEEASSHGTHAGAEGGLGKSSVSAPTRPSSTSQPKETSPSTTLQPDASHSLLSRKSYGPVPSVPMLRPSSSSSSSSDSLPPTNTRGSNASMHGSAQAIRDGAVRVRANSNGEPHGGVRSPTQTPQRRNTPPTSRVAPVPALNLSSMSLHGSADGPQRSASPFVTPSNNRSGMGAADAVVVGASLRSSAGGLQPAFVPAAQAPTQKAIPVVHLVPPAPSDSAELVERFSEDGRSSEASAPSFTNAEVSARPARASADGAPPLTAKQAQRGDDVLMRTSDASYSVEAQPFNDEDEEDELNAGVYAPHQDSFGRRLQDDIEVDEGSSSSNRSASSHGDGGNDFVMEDVLTDDNLAKTPMMRSTMATFAAPAQRPPSDTFSERESQTMLSNEEEEEEEEGNRRLYPVDEASLRPNERDDRRTRNDAPGEKVDAGAEASDSGEYSYYSYSYSDKDAEEDSGDESDAGRKAEDSGSEGKLSLSAPEAAPPMVASPTAQESASASADPRGALATRKAGLSTRAQRRRDKEDDGMPFSSHGELHAPSALPRVLSTELTGSEEVASVPHVHENSLQANVTTTMKKASGALKNLFKLKKK